MIVRKKKKCKGCGNETFLFSGGLCQGCAAKRYKKPLSKKPEKECLDKFFSNKLAILQRAPKSEESGTSIIYPTRVNICHILDKSRHPSVACHSKNFIFLTGDEHSRFDKLLFEHRFEDLQKEFPNSWNIMKVRLADVFDCCEEKTKLSEALRSVLT